MQKNAKAEFLSEALRQRKTVTVRCAEVTGQFHELQVSEVTAWTITTYGFVRANLIESSIAWIPWRRVFHMVAGDRHCVDWPNVPASVLDGYERIDMMESYKRYARNIVWFGGVSVGDAPRFSTPPAVRAQPAVSYSSSKPAATAPAPRKSKIPRGWRVIAGGSR